MASRSHSRAALAAALLLFGVTAAVWADEAPDLAAATGRAAPSIVSVQAVFPLAGMPVRMERDRLVFTNTGFFVSEDGQVLTSLFAVAACSDITVVSRGKRSPARVRAIDQAAGLALLQTDLSGTAPLTSAAEAPQPGAWFGTARAESGEQGAVLMPGRITATGSSLLMQGWLWQDMLRAQMDDPSGCAAAPTVDAEGRLIGLMLAVHTVEEMRKGGACYVLPTAQLSPILERMRRGESRRLGWLGVAIAEEPGRPEGAKVAVVLENSPAHLAGLRPGDLLLQIDGAAIVGPDVLASHIAQAGPRRGVRIQALHGQQMRSFVVDLQPRPLLICSMLPAPRTAPEPRDVQALMQQLVEENALLRQRVQELETRLQRLEQ